MTRAIRIVIISLDVGGTERHLLQVLPQLQAEGFSIRILALSQQHLTLKPEFEAQGITVTTPDYSKHRIIQKLPIPQRAKQLLISLGFLWKDYRTHKGDITHFFLPAAYGIGMLAALLARLKAPKLMSRRSLNYYQTNYPGFKRLESWLHTKQDLILANSQAIADQLEAEEGVPESKIKLIYNGIDLAPYQENGQYTRIRKQLKLEPNSLILIIIANLIPYKGHEDLLEALGQINDKLPKHWTLLCVGDDRGIGDALKTKSKQLGLKPHIQWLGHRDDTIDLLFAADIALLCSHEEGFSNAILEAMAATVPVIATDVGGNKEAVLHQETGLIVPAHNPEALGNAILTLTSDAHTRHHYGQAGRKRMEALFSLENCVAQYIRLYHSLI